MIHSKNKQLQVSDSIGITINKGVVWIRKDSVTIISRDVTTGLDDKTEVQLISGLQEGDEVITGYKKMQKKEVVSAKAAKSPFMPTRGGNTKKPVRTQ